MSEIPYCEIHNIPKVLQHVDGKDVYMCPIDNCETNIMDIPTKCSDIDKRHESDEKVICSVCGSHMVKRNGKKGPFWGCSEYPKCTHTISIEEVAKPKQTENHVPGVFCPECHSPMVYRSGQRGTFFGCSQYPKCKGTRRVNPKFDALKLDALTGRIFQRLNKTKREKEGGWNIILDVVVIGVVENHTSSTWHWVHRDKENKEIVNSLRDAMLAIARREALEQY